MPFDELKEFDEFALDRGPEIQPMPSELEQPTFKPEETGDRIPFASFIDYRYRKLVNNYATNIVASNRKRDFLKLVPTFYLSGVLAADAGALKIHEGTEGAYTQTLYTIPANSLSLNDARVDGCGN